MNNTLLETSAVQHEGEWAVSGGNTFWFQEIFCTLPLPSLERRQHRSSSVCHQPWLTRRSPRAENLWETQSSEEIIGSYETVGKRSHKTVWVGACGSGEKKVSGLGQRPGGLGGLGEGAGEPSRGRERRGILWGQWAKRPVAACWGSLPKGTRVHVPGGQTGTPFKSEGRSLLSGGGRKGWVGSRAAEGPGGSVQPSSHPVTGSAHGDRLWRARVPPWGKRGLFHSLLPALPWLLTRICLRRPTFHVPAWPFCSSRAKRPVPRVCGEYLLLKSPANSVTSFNNNKKLWGETGGCSAFIFI